MNPLPFALTNITRRPLRNWLTILGVVIGMAAIVGLYNVGSSLESSVTEVVENAGVQIISISGKTPGAPGSSADLSEEDLSVVESMSEYETVTALIFKIRTVEYSGVEKQVYIIGLTSVEEIYGAYGIGIESGRFFRDQDSKVVVVGNTFGELYDSEIYLGSQLNIEDQKFKIIGVMENIGSPQDDTSIYMPLDQAKQLFETGDSISLIQAVVKSGLDVNSVADKTFDKLENKRNNDDFEVSTPDQLLEQFGTILNIVNVVVLGVAIISLIVGAVGIANSMYTAVLERTQEIGIMKATGATNQQILNVFIVEASLIGAIGGAIGTAIGLGIGKLVEIVSISAGYTFINVNPSIGLVIFGVTFSTAFGAFSGFFPARNASKLQPVESLRD